MALFIALVTVTSAGREVPALATQACGANDANRANLQTRNGVALRPCLARVNLKIDIPRTQTSGSGCGLLWLSPCYADGKWEITGVNRSGRQTVKYVDGSTEELYRLTFREFRIIKDGKLSTQQASGGPAPGYTLRLSPDSAATLGGAGSTGATVITDLWVTGDSIIYLNFLTESCTGGTRVDSVVLDLVGSWLPISDTGCGMNLNVRYAVTSAETGSITGQYSVKLPNTTIKVDP